MLLLGQNLEMGSPGGTSTVFTKVGTFTNSTGSAVSQSITGLGFTPKLVIFWATGTTPDTSDSSVNMLYRSYGAASSATARWVVGNSISGKGHSDQELMSNACIHFNYAFSDATVLNADFTTMDSDGFTISVTASIAFTVSYMAFGGSGFSGKAGTWTATTSTGSQSITGVGFQGKGLITAYAFAQTAETAAADNNLSIGFATSSTNQGACGQILTVNGTSSTNVSGSVNNACILGFNASAGNDRRASFTSWGSDGFTLNWSFSPTASEQMGYIVLGGANFNCNVVQVTKPTSTGTQAITGVGFTPKAELLISQNMVQSDTTSGTPAAHISGGYQSFGAFDNTNYGSWGINHDSGTTSALQPYQISSTTNIFVRSSNSAQSTTVSAATISAQGTDGFTLNWSQTDATASQIFAMAIGDTGGGGTSITSTGTIASGATVASSTVLLTTKRAIIIDNGAVKQASDSYFNFLGKFKPLIFINGAQRLRNNTEGSPMVFGYNNQLRPLASSYELLLTPPTLSSFIYDNAAVAVYSTRKWSDSYTGSALNVRRSNDNGTSDIGFLPDGSLDTYSMMNYVGGQNLTTYSEQFDQWSTSSAIVNADAAVAPNYTKTADLVSNTPSVNSSVSNNVATLANSTAYTRSCYAKAISGNGILAFEMYTGTAYNNATFDLINGIATQSGITSVTMTYVNNGWWRCSAVYTTASSGTPAASTTYIGAYGNTATPTTIALWGNQLNATSTLLDYCQTVSSNVGAGSTPSAPVFQSESNIKSGSATSLTLNKPTGVANGDLLILGISYANPTDTMTPPTGFTAIGNYNSGGTASSDVAEYLYWKNASSEPTSYGISFSGATVCEAFMWRVTGADPTSPIGAVSNASGTGTTVTASSVTTTATNALLAFVGISNSTSSTTFSAPTGFTSREDPTTSAETWEIASKTLSSSGATGTASGTTNGTGTDKWLAIQMEIKPPSGSGANSGYVTKWYDQSGNSHDLSQSTTANQPRIINAGVIDNINNRPAIHTDGSSQNLTTSSFVVSQPNTRASVIQFDSVTNAGGQVLIDSSNSSLGFSLFINTGPSLWKYAGTSIGPLSATLSANNQGTVIEVAKGSTTYIRYNGTSTTNGDIGSNAMDGITVGGKRDQTNYTIAHFGELIIFPNEISTTSSQMLEANQKVYWGTS